MARKTVERLRVAMIRPGRFATALAVPLSENTNVTFCFASSKANEAFQETRENTKYHPGVILSSDIESTVNWKKGLMDADIVFVTAPMHYLRGTYRTLKNFGIEDKKVVGGSKGFEGGTNLRPSEVALDVVPRLSKASYAAISGPNIAREMIRKLPAVTVIASESETFRQTLQSILRTSYLFPYMTDDVKGIELGGALKNLVAMIVGISDGVGLGNNAAAALENRGLREMTRLAVMLGADERSFIGEAGQADLAVSCRPGAGGRNYDAGVAIGKGEDPRVLQRSGQTIEAFNTIGPAISLARKNEVKVPVFEGLNDIIRREKQPSYVRNLLVEGNHHYEDPEPIIHRGTTRWILRFLNRRLHIWKNPT